MAGGSAACARSGIAGGIEASPDSSEDSVGAAAQWQAITASRNAAAVVACSVRRIIARSLLRLRCCLAVLIDGGSSAARCLERLSKPHKELNW